MKHFSIIIPTLNEAGNIQPLLQQIAEVMKLHDLAPEVLFVDDGSTDSTRQQIVNYSGDLDVVLLPRDSEKGLAGAVIAGAEKASHELIVVMDADLSHPPSAIPELLEPLQNGTHDMVIGSRYIEGGETPDWPINRVIASQVASLPARLLTKTRDPLAGFFAVQRELLAAVDKNVAGFKIGLEILTQLKDECRVQEIPISFTDRNSGTSKMSMSVLGQYLGQLYRLFHNRGFSEHFGGLLLLTLIAILTDYSLFSFLRIEGYSLETNHLASFFAAMHICYAASLYIFKNKISPQPILDYFRFLTIILLASFLRGGLLALPALSQADDPNLLPIILASTSALSWIISISVIRTGSFHLQQTSNREILGVLLIGYTILLRLTYLGGTELIQEEAYYWNYAQHIAPGYLDHPPVVALLIKAGTILFGNNEFGVRFGAFTCWFLTAVFMYKLTKNIFNSTTAFRTVVLLSALPIFFGVALVSTPDAPLIACWAGTLYFLHQAIFQNKAASWYGVGIFLGVGLASKYTIAFLCPAIILYMLIDPPSRKWFFKPEPYAAAILALIIFSPVIWWNYQNDWASFLFQSQERFHARTEFSTHELLASILVLLTPTGLLAAYSSMCPRFKNSKLIYVPWRIKFNRNYLFCLITALIPLLIFILFSITKQVKLNWTGPIWLSILPFIAFTMAPTGQFKGRLQNIVAKMWPKTLVILALSYGAILHYCALGLPGISYASSDFLFGWDDLAQHIESEVQDITSERGERPLVVGMGKYRIASGLAFYRTKLHQNDNFNMTLEETIGSHLFGRNALMYKYWYPPAKAATRDILIVSQDKKRLDSSVFKSYYQDLDEINEITILKQGKKAGRYYSRLLKWYNPGQQEILTDTTPVSHPSIFGLKPDNNS